MPAASHTTNFFSSKKKDKRRDISQQASPSPSSNKETANVALPLINEGTQIDMNILISQMRDTMMSEYRRSFPGKSDQEYYEWFDNIEGPRIRQMVDTTVHWAKPASYDTTVRYVCIPVTHHHPSFVIRFWYGHQFGYNFDFIDPVKKVPVYPPRGIKIMYWGQATWGELISVKEAAKRGDGAIIPGPPQWVVDPGVKLRLISKYAVLIGELCVPKAPRESDVPEFETYASLEDALSDSSTTA